MEIAKDHVPNNPTMCFIQPHNSYFETDFNFADHQYKKSFEEGSINSEKSTGIVKNFSSSSNSLSSPSSTNSDGLGYPTVKYGGEEGNSVINFKGGFGNLEHTAEGSLLSFDQNDRFSSHNSFSRIISTNQDDYSIWEDNLHYTNYQNSPLLENSTSNIEVALGWLSSEPNANTTINNSIQDLGRSQEPCLSKRPYMGESTGALKKQCTAAATKMLKSKSKDPQSIAAKNRRERIGERMKVLQDLVPNGSKVDLVTMLEKAIGYVKFLQLQVKVLATDEFWPAQGGKAPDITQVRGAIDAILASQRDSNSSSK